MPYAPQGGGKSTSPGKLPSWTSETRPYCNPFLLGYNYEENRLEVCSDKECEDAWFYLWQAPIEGPESPLPPLFSDDFESSWYIPIEYTSVFAESFTSGWTFDESFDFGWAPLYDYIGVFSDNFDIGWAPSAEYVDILSDNFDSNWLTPISFNSIFSENFENGGW